MTAKADMTIKARVPVIFESDTQRACYIHSDDGMYLNGIAEWIRRPLRLVEEFSWSNRGSAEAFIRAHADQPPGNGDDPSLLPTHDQNPTGLHQRYRVEKLYGESDPLAIYFALRLDQHGDDQLWIDSCREAANQLCNGLRARNHMLPLAGDLSRLLESTQAPDSPPLHAPACNSCGGSGRYAPPDNAAEVGEGIELPNSDDRWLRDLDGTRWDVLVRGEWAIGFHEDTPIRMSHVDEFPKGGWRTAQPSIQQPDPAVVACPECNGSGKSGLIPLHVRPIEGHKPTEQQLRTLAERFAVCQFCDGAKTVPQNRVEWRAVGESWRLARMELRVGMRHWAESCGCLPSDYCDMEAGRIRPDVRFAPCVASQPTTSHAVAAGDEVGGVKLYEIGALVKYAVVVAAVSKEDALQHVETWEDCWPGSSDLIGVSDVEVTDVRDVKSSDLEDEAHEVTAAAKAIAEQPPAATA